MRTFLGVLMVLIVSGDNETIKGVLEDSVLLPCNCSKRDLDKGFKWQIGEESPKRVLTYRTTSDFYGRYKDRAKIFVAENSDNCSVLLTNITADDQGKYKCIFHSQVYERFSVNLDVSARYNVCQKNESSSVFQCDVKGRYKEAEIQWKMDEQLLTSSPTTQISHTYTLDAPTGLYHFNSTLITKLIGTSEPTCFVKAKRISTIISNDCSGMTGRFQSNPDRLQPEYSMRYFKIIPIVLVLGLSLVLWRRWKFSQGVPKIKEVETDNF